MTTSSGSAQELTTTELDLDLATRSRWPRPRGSTTRRSSARGVRSRQRDRHHGLRVPGRRPAQLRRLVRRPPHAGHRVRAQPPGHRHHAPRGHAAVRLRARRRHQGGHRRARRHQALARRARAAPATTTPTSRRTPTGIAEGMAVEAGDGRRLRRHTGNARGGAAAPPLRDPPRRRPRGQPVPAADGRPTTLGCSAARATAAAWTSPPTSTRRARRTAVRVGRRPRPVPGVARHRAAPGASRAADGDPGPAWRSTCGAGSARSPGRSGCGWCAPRTSAPTSVRVRAAGASTAATHSPWVLDADGRRRRGERQPPDDAPPLRRRPVRARCSSGCCGDEIERSRPRLLALRWRRSALGARRRPAAVASRRAPSGSAESVARALRR